MRQQTALYSVVFRAHCKWKIIFQNKRLHTLPPRQCLRKLQNVSGVQNPVRYQVSKSTYLHLIPTHETLRVFQHIRVTYNMFIFLVCIDWPIISDGYKKDVKYKIPDNGRNFKPPETLCGCLTYDYTTYLNLLLGWSREDQLVLQKGCKLSFYYHFQIRKGLTLVLNHQFSTYNLEYEFILRTPS